MGYTLSADYQTGVLQNTGLFQSMRFGLAYTHLDPTIKTIIPQANISRYAVESLKEQLTGTVSAELLKVLSLTVTARYCERISYKDYTIMDARIAYKLKSSSIYFDASNIFDVNFIQAGAVPMPGVWTTLGYRVAF